MTMEFPIEKLSPDEEETLIQTVKTFGLDRLVFNLEPTTQTWFVAGIKNDNMIWIYPQPLYPEAKRLALLISSKTGVKLDRIYDVH